MSNFLRKVIVLALAQFSNFRRHSLSCKLSGEVRFVSDLAVATFKRVKRQDFFLKFFYKILFSLYLKSPFSFIICWTTVNGGKALILLLFIIINNQKIKNKKILQIAVQCSMCSHPHCILIVCCGPRRNKRTAIL
jgi:hypothetical protein